VVEDFLSQTGRQFLKQIFPVKHGQFRLLHKTICKVLLHSLLLLGRHLVFVHVALDPHYFVYKLFVFVAASRHSCQVLNKPERKRKQNVTASDKPYKKAPFKIGAAIDVS
jgi:hypothetical protein